MQHPAMDWADWPENDPALDPDEAILESDDDTPMTESVEGYQPVPDKTKTGLNQSQQPFNPSRYDVTYY